jgi:phage terminase large subunit
MADITFPLREHQRDVHKARKRFGACVMHRRGGKSVYAVARLIEDLCAHDVPGYKLHYCGPTYKQTKSIAWAYVCKFAESLPGSTLNIQELKLTLRSGATLELLGAESIDSLRGRYSQGIVVDEAQLMPVSHWLYVIRALLADRGGWALISGTPASKHNLLYWATQQEGWAYTCHTVEQTTALEPEEIADIRAGLSEEAWQQEFMCSFTAALVGAFYAREMGELERGGRYTTVRFDPTMPVVAALDLGWRDLMPCIFAQVAGSELRIIGQITYNFTSLPDILENWAKVLTYRPQRVILPHDARVHELGSGKTRQEVIEALGYETSICVNQSLDEGIEAVKVKLRNIWIDKENASDTFEALSAYRSKLNEVAGVYSKAPLHDWASHTSDAVRYLVLGDHRIEGLHSGPAKPLGSSNYGKEIGQRRGFKRSDHR